MEARAGNAAVKSLFAKLSEIEVKHQESIFRAWRDLTSQDVPLTEFEKNVTVKATEGGLSTDQYLDLFNPDLDASVDVISLAMSIEAQALDLYQRAGRQMESPETRAIVNQIAREEKSHLKSLGSLMDELGGQSH